MSSPHIASAYGRADVRVSSMNPQRVLCDCCQEHPWTRYGIVSGIETNYCGVCAGLTPEEAEEEWQDDQDEENVP